MHCSVSHCQSFAGLDRGHFTALQQLIWKDTVRKSLTNATNVNMHPVSRVIWGHTLKVSPGPALQVTTQQWFSWPACNALLINNTQCSAEQFGVHAIWAHCTVPAVDSLTTELYYNPDSAQYCIAPHINTAVNKKNGISIAVHWLRMKMCKFILACVLSSAQESWAPGAFQNPTTTNSTVHTCGCADDDDKD